MSSDFFPRCNLQEVLQPCSQRVLHLKRGAHFGAQSPAQEEDRGQWGGGKRLQAQHAHCRVSPTQHPQFPCANVVVHQKKGTIYG